MNNVMNNAMENALHSTAANSPGSALENVLQRNDTWRGTATRAVIRHAGAATRRLATGHPELDDALAGNGWPLDGTIEVLSEYQGPGAMGLFLPALQTLARRQHWLIFIDPPCDIYAPLLANHGIDTRRVIVIRPDNREDLLWSTEQALNSNTCGAVFSWLREPDIRYAELRKLQLAATAADKLSVLFRPAEAAHEHAPASLRLHAGAYPRIEILKQRGSHRRCDFRMPLPQGVPVQPALWRAGGAERPRAPEVLLDQA